MTVPAEAGVSTGVTIHEVRSSLEVAEALAPIAACWGDDGPGGPVTVPFVQALVMTGGLLLMARDADGRNLGCLVAITQSAPARALYTHVLAVTRGRQNGGVGRRLMEAQLAWARAHGYGSLSLLFDPLVRRNAWVYLAALGGRADRYLVDPYGPMTDVVNRGQGSDRVAVRWDLQGEATPRHHDDEDAVDLVTVDAAGRPRTHAPRAARRVRIELPADIERLRHADPRLGREWRRAVREALGTRMTAGWTAGATRSGWILDSNGHVVASGH